MVERVRVFKTLKEVKEKYFPNRSLDELEGRKAPEEMKPHPNIVPEPQQPKVNKSSK